MGSAGHVKLVTERARQWIREIPPSGILVAGWLWLMVFAFPGVMTMDSFDQLAEGRAWFFTDSHPPIMAAVWGLVDRILPGSLGMLVLQSTAFLIGLYLILRRVMRPRRAAICACLILVFPPVMTPLAVIWKDCVMAGLLVLGVAGTLSTDRRIRILGLVAFAGATAMRYTALAATLPLVVLLFEWQPNQRALKRYALAAGTWLAITIVALGCNAALTDRKMHFWHQSLALQDIAGVLAFVDETIPDSELRPLLAPTEIKVDANIHDAIRAKYRSDDFQQLISGDGQLWRVPWTDPMPEARRDAISNAWLTLLEQYPGAYVRYRLENFGETLGVNDEFRSSMVVPHRAQYPGMLDHMGLGRGTSKFQRFLQNKYVSAAQHTRLWRPHVYALLALALLAFCIRQRLAGALLLSGLFMEATMLVLGGTPDYRYSHWLVSTTCLSLVLLIALRMKERT